MSGAVDATSDRPHYSDLPLPPYSYVPGATPHPVSDPRGHMFGAMHPPVAALDPEQWPASPMYLYAIDLFNHGYYWEAHEAWESLWHAAGRTGLVANWLKGLIKLAAAGVKAREGNPSGVHRHIRRAVELISAVRTELPAGAEQFCGVNLGRLEQAAQEVAAAAERDFSQPNAKLMLSARIELTPS